MDLQVHHVNYDHVGNEDVYNDLITLCKYCHEAVESQKKKYKEERSNYWEEQNRIETLLSIQFAKDYEDKDVVRGGNLNMMNRDIVQAEGLKWRAKKGITNNGINASTVISYFRKIRIEIILEMAEGGATMDMILARGISYNMVRKYYGKTELMQKILESYRKEEY